MLEEKIEELTAQIVELNRLLTRFIESKAPESKAPESKAPESKAPESKAPESKAPESKAPESKAPESKAPDDAVLRQAALRLAARKGKRYVLELIRQQFGASQLSQIPDEDKIAALALLNKELSKCSEND